MILSWIHTMLGTWGSAVLDFYTTNSLWVNLFILAYGVWIVLSWINLKKIRFILVSDLVSQLNNQQVKPVPGKSVKLEKQAMVIPWQSAVEQVRFPFIAHQVSFWPRHKSIKTVQAMLSIDDLTATAKRIFKAQARKKRAGQGDKIASS